MLRLPIGIVVALLAGMACDGGDTPGVDAPGGDGAPTIDAPAMCTGALYDTCTNNTQCMSNNCRLFQQAGLQVCTQTCDAQSPCPPQNGQAVQCNNMGICRPQIANACTPP